MAPQVPKDKAAGVAAAATAENLNRALASSGISVGAVSSPKILADADFGADTSTPATVAPAATGGLAVAALAGIIAGVLVLVLLVAAGAGACCWNRSRRVQQAQLPVRIPTRPVT